MTVKEMGPVRATALAFFANLARRLDTVRK
jgi:hypothetical protein